MLTLFPQALTIVPTTISYDSPLEEASMLREVAGAPKQKEQLGALLATAVRLVRQLYAGPRDALSHPPSGAGGRCGCVVISFGEPVNVKRFLKVGGRTSHVLAEKSNHNTHVAVVWCWGLSHPTRTTSITAHTPC